MLLTTCSFLVDLTNAHAVSIIDGKELALSIRDSIPPENISLEASMEVTFKDRKRINK